MKICAKFELWFFVSTAVLKCRHYAKPFPVIANAKKPLEDEINKKQIMVNTIVNNKTKPNFTENIGKVLFVLSGIFLFIAALSVFQDFLESRRSGFDF